MLNSLVARRRHNFGHRAVAFVFACAFVLSMPRAIAQGTADIVGTVTDRKSVV